MRRSPTNCGEGSRDFDVDQIRGLCTQLVCTYNLGGLHIAIAIAVRIGDREYVSNRWIAGHAYDVDYVVQEGDFREWVTHVI